MVAGGRLDSLLGAGGAPPFDTVILDEASQLTVPMALGAIRLGRRFVLVGDHQQLPPVVQSEALAETLFEQLWRQWERCAPPPTEDPRATLITQYRMNAAIAHFPNAEWYGARLEDSESVRDRRLALRVDGATANPMEPAALAPDAGAVAAGTLTGTGARPEPNARAGPLRHDGWGLGPSIPPQATLDALLDPALPALLAHLPHERGRGRDGRLVPRRNAAEARLAAFLARRAVARGLDASEIGVIAPYRAQVALVRELLSGAGPTAGVLVDTVDRFQGSERDLIIVTLAIHGPRVGELLEDLRRLNVALTRARRKLILIGDVDVLAGHPFYRRLASAYPTIKI
jgi:DNA replication ATP-dependent helicase Dna2